MPESFFTCPVMIIVQKRSLIVYSFYTFSFYVFVFFHNWCVLLVMPMGGVFLNFF